MALILISGFMFPFNAMASAKRRIAILPFEYGAVSSSVGTYDVGKGIVGLLITNLVNDGTYSVIDRQMLDSILKEQNLSVSDRADPATACKIGKILSVDAIVVGTVTQFGFESHSTNVGGIASYGTGYIPYVGGLGGLGGFSTHKSKVKVAIDARVIDSNTTEILASCHGSGESKRSGASLGLVAGADWGSSDFASSIAGEATMMAVNDISNQLVATAAKIPDNQSLALMNVQGKVADVTGNQVTVNVGKNNGLAVGDNLTVDRVYKTIKDPDSGKVLKELSHTVALISLSQVEKDSATGSITKGSGVSVGDPVKKVTTDVSAIVIAEPEHSISATGTILKKPPTPTTTAAGSAKATTPAKAATHK